MSTNVISQVSNDTTRINRIKTNNRAPVAYSVNSTLGGDNVLSSLKIEIVGDNLQVHRNIGTNNWSYQYYEWSNYPARGVHLYIDGNFFEVDNSTDIFVNGNSAADNSSYLNGYGGDTYDRVEIVKIDNYNATVKLVKDDYVEALLEIYYPPESDYVNYTWHITNNSGSTMNDLRFYQAGDTYSYGEDYGVGYWDGPSNTVGCQKDENGETVSVYLQSIETPYQHESAHYSSVEDHVMANALTGEVRTDWHDNGIALEWRQATLNPGGTWTIHTIEKYSDKDITDLIVTAPFNEYIYAGTTKEIVFNVKNNTTDPVNDIVLEEVIDLSGWTIDILSPIGVFDLGANEDIDVLIEVFCPVTEPEGTIAQATLGATANEEEANDKAYIEVLSNMPGLEEPPIDQTVCSEIQAVIFWIRAGNTDNLQWQINDGGWTDLSDNAIYSGTNTDTLIINDVTGLIGAEYRCILSNMYGEVQSNGVFVLPDNDAPVPDLLNLPAEMGQCDVYLTPPTAIDNCMGTINGTTTSIDSLHITDQGTYEIIWTFEDDFGNSSTRTQTVIIDDTQIPVRDQSILPPVFGDCSAAITEIPTATDNCAGTILGTTNDSLSYDTAGVYIITWLYDDGNGNTNTQTQQVIVDDQNPPIPDSTSLPEVSSECSLDVLEIPTATDGCDGKINATTETIFPIIQSTTVIWLFEDNGGNISTQEQNIIIIDEDAPIPDNSSLDDITIECQLDTIIPPTATDFCSGNIIATSNVSFPLFQSTTVNWVFEDLNGNISTQEQSITILDEAPIPDTVNLNDLIAECQIDTIIPPTASDYCDGKITASADIEFPLNQSTEIIWTYEDSNGNILNQSQNIIIDDISAPIPEVSELPYITETCFAVANNPYATDNCSGLLVGTTTDEVFYENVGTYSITWNYEDYNGNITSQIQYIEVINDAPVVITNDMTVTIFVSSTSQETITITPEDINLGSYDDCAIDSMYLDISEFTVNDEGENTVTLTVVDKAGNVSTQTAIVTVVLEYSLEIPNLITPDGNGVNDYWVINGLQVVEGYYLQIFNKLGELVYSSYNYDNTWDATYNGQPLPQGTYYYVFKSDYDSYTGYVSVIR